MCNQFIRFIFTLLVFSLCIAVTTELCAEESSDQESDSTKSVLEVGSPCPRLAVFDIYGERFDNADRIGKKFLLVNFFGTYCIPCIREFPEFIKLLELYENRVDLILVNVGQDSREDLKRFQLKHKIEKAIILRDRFSLMQNEFGVDNVPVTFLVDPGGVVIYSQYGTFPDEKPLKVLEPLIEARIR